MPIMVSRMCKYCDHEIEPGQRVIVVAPGTAGRSYWGAEIKFDGGGYIVQKREVYHKECWVKKNGEAK